MRRNSYLNVILTVNALLLAGLVWVQVADEPLMANTATAQVRSKPTEIKVPNAAAQRQAIVDELKKTNQSLEALKRTIESGGLQVEVANAEQFGG